METELFSWDGWDGDHECMVFYNVTLKVPVGDIPAGTKFDSAVINHTNEGKGVLQLNNYGEEKDGVGEVNLVAEFRLHIKVGERIS